MTRKPIHTPMPPGLRARLEEAAPAERAALEKAWRAAEYGRPRTPSPDPARKAAVWKAVDAAADAARRTPRRTDRGSQGLRLVRTTTLRWMAAAAVVLLLVGLGLGYWLTPVTVTAPRGETMVAALPDGSTATLNSGSTVAYRRGLAGAARRVRLEGEAFFEVRKGNRPFTVETFNAETTVLGTSFSVRARPSEPDAATTVAVVSGRVRVAPKATSAGDVVLAAGQTSRVDAAADHATPPDTTVTRRLLAWRSGELAWRDQPFAVILSDIERRYDVDIQAPDAVLRRRSGLWVHAPAGAEDVLADITQATGLRYRATANGFEVYVP